MVQCLAQYTYYLARRRMESNLEPSKSKDGCFTERQRVHLPAPARATAVLLRAAACVLQEACFL